MAHLVHGLVTSCPWNVNACVSSSYLGLCFCCGTDDASGLDYEIWQHKHTLEKCKGIRIQWFVQKVFKIVIAECVCTPLYVYHNNNYLCLELLCLSLLGDLFRSLLRDLWLREDADLASLANILAMSNGGVGLLSAGLRRTGLWMENTVWNLVFSISRAIK